MYTLLRSVGLREGLVSEAPALAISIVVAEAFYKFHSFTLECVTFLATWVAVSYLFSLVRRVWTGKRPEQA